MYERPTVAVNQKSTTLVLGHSDGFAQCSPGLHLCWCTCSIHRLPGDKSDRQSEREHERENRGSKEGRQDSSKQGRKRIHRASADTPREGSPWRRDLELWVLVAREFSIFT
ncbi:hypothetical protein M758_5G167400 [Ceratodon purpureus]|nr:hypothetical protein M758_5G167400 [Ceratodon purpureus]